MGLQRMRIEVVATTGVTYEEENGETACDSLFQETGYESESTLCGHHVIISTNMANAFVVLGW